jgi:hypothetical protein
LQHSEHLPHSLLFVIAIHDYTRNRANQRLNSSGSLATFAAIRRASFLMVRTTFSASKGVTQGQRAFL